MAKVQKKTELCIYFSDFYYICSMKQMFIIFTLWIVMLPTTLQAQSWEAIQHNGQYLWGLGYGSTVSEADNNALADLISKIATHVQSDFQQEESEMTNGEKSEQQLYVRNRVQTYSQATLTNAERLVLKNEPDAQVGRYILKSEIHRLFESRQKKAIDMVRSALRAEEAGKADDALRNYYWALALVRSLQYPNEAIFRDDDGNSHLLMTWIPEQMNHVFDDLKVSVIQRKGDDVDLSIAYKGKRVSSVDYTYFDGRDWSAINSAKDGAGVLELARGNQSTKYQLKFEYEYLSETHIDKEVEAVLRVLSGRAMRKAYTTIDAATATGEAFTTRESFTQTDASILKAPTNTAAIQAKDYDQAVNSALNAIRNKSITGIEQYFTAEGLDIFQRLVFQYGTARIIGSPQITFYSNDGGEVTARGAKVAFSFKNGIRKSFVEDLVFTLNATGKIDNVAFGLGKTAEDDILNKGVWSESARKVLMAFLENYKTAYALKRLDYINTIFDDDAVIIVANVAKRAQGSWTDGQRYQDNKIIKYNRYSKDQYLKNLSRCFNTNEFINIRFANNDVVKLGKGGETYGIQISQDYYSSSYGDKGYLFLEVDVNDPKQPIIKVRTWQPEKDPNFGLYGPGDFK